MQDPMKPMTNQEMVAQLATIRELEMNTRLAGRLEQLTDQQRFGSAAVLIGKHVKGSVTDAEGTEFETAGIVTGVRFTPKGEVLLELDTGEYMPMAALREVKNADGTLAFSV
jgi:flagellar hook assembly protein FlgD